MLDIRSVERVDDFAAPDDDPGDLGWVEEMWKDGSSRPGWTFVASDAGSTVGRAGFVVTPSVTDPAWVGSLPLKRWRSLAPPPGQGIRWGCSPSW